MRTHTCTLAELGLEQDKSQSRFYEIKPSRLAELKNYAPFIQYFDQEEILMNGNFNAA